MKPHTLNWALFAFIFTVFAGPPLRAAEPVIVPQIDGDWWQIAGDPDLGKLTTAKQQPVDFTVWQAADGTWQLWSCIRNTAAPGNTRLFHGWQGGNLTDRDWQPRGIMWQSDPGLGEKQGGVQSPFVTKVGDEYLLFYGDWDHICMARSRDGKTFARNLMPDGKSGMLTEGIGKHTRDPMLLHAGDLFYLYGSRGYDRAGTFYPGAVFLRTSKDLRQWSESKIVATGGRTGNGSYSAECPFVYFHRESSYYYLFRTQRYGKDALTSVYRSKDPTDFGVDDDSRFVAELPIAAPEIVEYQGRTYLAALLPSLKGIQLVRLRWGPKP
jgi:hypothetical protein